MRIVFFGTPDFAVASLAALVENNYEVAAVVTAPDKPAGRGHKMQPSAVKEYAESKALPVLQPTNLKSDEFVDQLKTIAADIQIVVAFRMLPEAVWNMPPLGTYNIHGSLLPNYRGAAPINWAIINGEKVTGVTSFKLKHEIDTGSILMNRSIEIGPNDTAGEVYERLMHEGATLLIDSLKRIETGDYQLKEQDPKSDTKHAPKIFKQDCKINWNQSAMEIHNFIRGLSPFPCAFTEVSLDGNVETWKIQRTTVSDLKCSNTSKLHQEGTRLFAPSNDFYLEILELQTPGKRKLSASEFLNGYKGDLPNLN